MISDRTDCVAPSRPKHDLLMVFNRTSGMVLKKKKKKNLSPLDSNA
jgi:hypothetical protein